MEEGGGRGEVGERGVGGREGGRGGGEGGGGKEGGREGGTIWCFDCNNCRNNISLCTLHTMKC